jgi:hypothetical protein
MNTPEVQHDKFEELDLPKILAALQKARTAKSVGRVTIDFAENGGIVAIFREMKEKLK